MPSPKTEKPTKRETMGEQIRCAQNMGYELHSRDGEWNIATLTRMYDGDNGVCLTLRIVRKTNDKFQATIAHIPNSAMVKIESMDFSFPHWNYEKLFEQPVLRLARLYRAATS